MALVRRASGLHGRELRAFATGKTKAHAPGSLEMIVENLVKTWEMERSHKSDPTQHKTVDQERFSIGANGGKMFNNLEANEVGNYNLLRG